VLSCGSLRRVEMRASKPFAISRRPQRTIIRQSIFAEMFVRQFPAKFCNRRRCGTSKLTCGRFLQVLAQAADNRVAPRSKHVTRNLEKIMRRFAVCLSCVALAASVALGVAGCSSSEPAAGGKMETQKMNSGDMSNKMSSDKMGTEKMGSDKMGSDKMGSDKMGSDKMGSDKMGDGK
jgi:pentapeptide MXKDX repeat protein